MAEHLLSEHLVACGQIQKIESHYVWKNQRYVTAEFLLCLKTRKRLLKALETEIKKKHSYEVAEISCTKIACSKEYAAWIEENTEKGEKYGDKKNC